jgi:gamma-glutamylcyclotransferase (GGCT)/AIG2-like uncharacterized protein YtfP
MTNLFFVYGTLKLGYGNNRVLGNSSKFIGKGVTTNRYKVYNIGFPLACYSKKGKPMLGEIFEVTESSVVEALDRLEGQGRFYTRVKRLVKNIDFFDQELLAWIYEIPENSILLTGGLCNLNKQFNAYEWNR